MQKVISLSLGRSVSQQQQQRDEEKLEMQLKTNHIGQKLLRGHESYFEAGQSLIKWCKLTLGASRLAIF
jgi:hypothetical protein